MPAYFDSGFCVRQPSWHAQELLLSEPPTIENWREVAGLDWEPVKIPLPMPVGEPVAYDEHDRPLYLAPEQSGTFLLARSDRLDAIVSSMGELRDSAILSRGVSESYEPIEHERDATPIIDAMQQAAASMGIKTNFETAGSARDGKQTYASLKLDRPIDLGSSGDPSLTFPYFVLLLPHDGAGSCRGGITMVRVVCANTYAGAEADIEGHGLGFTIRHSGDVQERLEQARQQIAGWVEAIETYESTAQIMLATKVTAEIADEWVDELLPVIPERMTERQINNRLAEQARFRELHTDSITTDGIRGTAYGLWQTTIEFVDHIRPYRSADSYLRRTLLEEHDVKAAARDRIMEMAGA